MEVSYLAALGAGFLMFLSPCILPLVPVYTAAFLNTEQSSRWARVKATLFFVLGFTLIFVLLGLGVPALNSLIGEHRSILLAVVGLGLLAFGLKMMGLLKLKSDLLEKTFFFPDLRKKVPKSLGSFIFGTIFALGWTPCAGPVLAAILSFVSLKNSSAFESAGLLFSFAMGVGLPLIAISWASESSGKALAFFKKHTLKIERVCGAVLSIWGLILLVSLLQAPSVTNSTPTALEATHYDQIAVTKPQVLFFHSESCHVCQEMEKFIPAVLKQCGLGEDIFRRVDVNASFNAALNSSFNIRATPTLVAINQEGRETVVGFQSPEDLVTWLEKKTGRLCRGQSQPQSPKKLNSGTTCQSGVTCSG